MQSVLIKLRREVTGLLDLLLPPACPLCGKDSPGLGPADFCCYCLADFQPLDSPRCPRCAFPYATEGGSDHLCENCIRQAPPFAWVEAVGHYQNSLRQAVHRLKHQGAIYLDRPLGMLMAKSLADHLVHFDPDLIIPVPLHRLRLRKRSYNQSLLLARALSKILDVPVATDLLMRHRDTASQQGLDADSRRRNLRSAFRLQRPLHGEKVLLIDDVLTTGATACECSRVLLSGSAAEVAVAVIARVGRSAPLVADPSRIW